MSLWPSKPLYAVAPEVRETVDPTVFGDDEVEHYSIPALDATGLPDVVPASEILSGKQRLRGGEVMVSRLNPRKARVLAVPPLGSRTALASGEFVVVRPVGIETRFLTYILLAESTRQYLDSMVQSVTRSHQRIRPEHLMKLPVPVPAVGEQRAIADYLDAETARIDALIAKKRRLIELLDERFEAAVFQSITTGLRAGVPMRPSGLSWVSEIPEGWGTPTISANFETQLGKMLNADAASGSDQYPYLRNVNVQWDHFRLDDLATMHFDASDRRRCELRRGDVLVCEGGEVGRAAVWQGDLDHCYFQKAIHRVRPRRGANGRYLMYCLRAAAKRSVFAVEGNLSTIVHLTGEQLSVHRFPWPPEDEQAEIVDHLDEAARRTGEARSRVARQIDLLVEHRQALITAAVTGEIEVPGVAA